jgi:hypothetical protein
LEQNEITYLFGAGASYESMPLVSSFSERFQIYIFFLNGIGGPPNFVKENEHFLRDIKSHLSFDTYFKKLFHQKNRQQDISRSKYLIYLFFLYEHLIDTNYVNSKANERGFKCRKDFGCDPRYDALIAALLKPLPQTCEFYCNINFLTWNYDLNLPYSIWNFLTEKNSFQNLLATSLEAKNIFYFHRQLRIIQLNGYIDAVELINGLGSNSIEILKDKFQRLIANYNNDSYVEQAVSGLSFSWENVGPKNKFPDFIFKAAEAIKRSHTVIVIGYSFPLYNRLFDLAILNPDNLKNKVLYIIDPNALELKRKLHTDFGFIDNSLYKVGNIPSTNISPSTVSDSFFVPPNLFR